MTTEQLAATEQTNITFIENIKTLAHQARARLGLLAAVGTLMAGGSAVREFVDPATARADAVDDALASYPDKNMPCQHAPYNVTGPCANYDWGLFRTETFNHPSQLSSRGYSYRNCTDWVAFRLGQIAGYEVSRKLGNGGQWYDNASPSQRSTAPKAWDAAVVPGNPGHVAFVESVSADGRTMTVSEYNRDGQGHGSQRTIPVAGSGFTRFVDFNARPNEGGSSVPSGAAGLQMILDGAGQVWAKDSIGYGQWTRETPAGEQAIAAGSNGLQMILDSAGQVWAKRNVGDGGWTLETPPGITAIAAGADGQQMILDGAGQVWAKSSIGYGQWIPETPAGEKAIAMGDNGLQMILDGAGQVWAKNSIGYGAWTQETPPGESAIAAGDDGLQMILDGIGQVWARRGIGYYGSSGWTQETPPGEVAISAGSSGLQMILDGAGQVWAKNSIGYGAWTQETPPGETKIAAGDNGQQLILDGIGQVWAKSSIGYGQWIPETPAGEAAIATGS